MPQPVRRLTPAPLPASAGFRALFDRYIRPVRRFLKDLLHDDMAADEAAQETFVRAASRLESLREGDRVGSWLFGIARNVYLEQRRARTFDELDGEAETSVLSGVLPAPNPESLL